MYLQHFGLTELPFSLTPDTEYVFSHQGHQAALNTALEAMQVAAGSISSRQAESSAALPRWHSSMTTRSKKSGLNWR